MILFLQGEEDKNGQFNKVSYRVTAVNAKVFANHKKNN